MPNGRSLDDDHYQYKLWWLDRLLEHLDADTRPDQAVIVGGDFNIAPDDRDVHDPAKFVGATHVSDAERDRLAALEAWGWSTCSAATTTAIGCTPGGTTAAATSTRAAACGSICCSAPVGRAEPQHVVRDRPQRPQGQAAERSRPGHRRPRRLTIVAVDQRQDLGREPRRGHRPERRHRLQLARPCRAVAGDRRQIAVGAELRRQHVGRVAPLVAPVAQAATERVGPSPPRSDGGGRPGRVGEVETVEQRAGLAWYPRGDRRGRARGGRSPASSRRRADGPPPRVARRSSPIGAAPGSSRRRTRRPVCHSRPFDAWNVRSSTRPGAVVERVVRGDPGPETGPSPRGVSRRYSSAAAATRRSASVTSAVAPGAPSTVRACRGPTRGGGMATRVRWPGGRGLERRAGALRAADVDADGAERLLER